jgi:hypothetical protein
MILFDKVLQLEQGQNVQVLQNVKVYFKWGWNKSRFDINSVVTRKRGDGRYYFALWQTNNNTPNKLLLSESAVSCLLRVRSVFFTSRSKGCIKFVPHSCLVSLSHKVGVFLEEAICYFIYAKFAVMSLKVVYQYGCFESCQFLSSSVFYVSSRLKCLADDFRCLRYYSIVATRPFSLPFK